MWNEPKKEQLDSIVKLYATEHVPLKDKTIHLHFFLGGCDWYVCEFDGGDIFFGFVCLNNDLIAAEWGFISLSDLKTIKVHGIYEVEHDEYWKIRPAREVKLICEAQGWNYNKVKNEYA
jgi:hypothetical protein